MPMLSFRKASKRVAECAAYICAALALSFLETLIPLNAVVFIPGFKLGLCNIAVILAFFRTSPCTAFFVTVVRVFLSSALFGGMQSFIYSLAGAVLSFAVLCFVSVLLNGKMSFFGISIACAVAHNAGQILVAACFFTAKVAIYLSVPLAISGVICGAVTGGVLTALPDSVFSKRRME